MAQGYGLACVRVRIEVLGSGASDGWPNPWCSCASCAAAREQGVRRTQSCALVDDLILLDVGPASARHDLSRVRAVLVTHPHLDHHFPQVWAWRAWARHSGPLTLLAPPSVLAQARLDPSITAVEAHPGDEHDVLGYRVRVLAANHTPDAVLYDVESPGGDSLLYACDTGPLPDATVAALDDRGLDVLLLELTGGDLPTHLDLQTWPRELQRLRDVSAVTRSTRVWATHLGHGNPPPDELDRLLAEHRACAARDGQRIDTAPYGGYRVLVLGGQSSGKSAYAESRISGDVTYVATAPARPDDPDWQRRVDAHVQRRPGHWATVETGDVAGLLAEDGGPVLVDDLGLWVTRVLDGHWDSPDARTVFHDALHELEAAWAGTSRHVVLVAPEVGSGVVPDNAAARLFADLLGRATTELARSADEVVQVVAGRPRQLA
jgi:adenosylcobinamide kinase/adenosylcobinamide-phosphate guanylyltransferase